MTEQLRAESLQASLTVRNLDRSADWYTEVLGFEVDRRHEREGKLIAVSLRAGAVRILLAQDDGARGFERQKGEGMSALVTEPVTAPHGARIFRLRDPDGFRLTISSTGKD